MNAIRRFFTNWWVVSILATALIATALALALPIWLDPLRPWWARALLAGVPVLIWAGLALWRILKRRKAADRIEKAIVEPSALDREQAQVGERLKEALEQLKKSAGGKRDYLYAKPWYVIIGPPGAGKTTALLKSGLRFPYADAALKGVGGTRNVDFWFAEEAVLVDTAGRYTSQDSDAQRDRDGWKAFLGLLRKNRPLQPVNGVFIAIGLDDIATAQAAQLDEHANTIRRRIEELQEGLEVKPPVYVFFTKADKIAGFTEYFEDLDAESRRSVLGVTFPWNKAEPVQSEMLAEEFDLLAQAVADRTSKRIQAEMDIARRGLIVGFSPQLTGLRARVIRFLEGVAPAASGPRRALLRGFYFTSGVQVGAPLDRILGGLALAYDQPRAALAGRGEGRSFFLNRLLNEVAFAEAGLVSADPKAVARRRAVMIGAFAGVGVLTVAALGLWTTSFLNNRAFQTKLAGASAQVQADLKASGIDLAEVRSTDPDLEAAASVLRTLRNLPRGYAEQRRGGTPLMMGFGLYQEQLATESELAYREGLQRIMLPRILLRLEQVIRAGGSNAMAVYDPLKVYLMLGGQGPFDAKTIKNWVMDDWAAESLPGPDREQLRNELAQHLDALLADPQLGRVWPGGKAPLDGQLIASARSSVQTLSLADRAYLLLKAAADTAEQPDWTADTVLSAGSAKAFANPDAVMALRVPFFYTKPGYAFYQVGLQKAQADLQRDLWVLGADAETAGLRAQMSSVRPGVAGLYAQDYIKAWNTVIATLQPANYATDPAALSAFVAQPSPLKLILLEVRKNTLFPPARGGGLTGQVANRVASRVGLSGQLSRELAGSALKQAAGGQIDAGAQIDAEFRTIHVYVGDEKRAGEIDAFVNAIREAGKAQMAAATAGGGVAAAATQGNLALATGSLSMAAAGAPPALLNFVTTAISGGKAAAVSSGRGAVAQTYAAQILGPCQATVEDKYPFYGAAQADAPVADMLRIFGLNGTLDNFIRADLSSLLDASKPIWRWRSEDPIAAGFNPVSAGQLQKAAQVRDLLSGQLVLKVSLVSLGGAVGAADFVAGDQAYRFEPGATGERTIAWSATGSLPEATVTLYPAAATQPTASADAPADAARPAAKKELAQFRFEGPWALFRLFEAARKENAGPTQVKATFGDGAAFATFMITLPSGESPFSRGGMWSFRCPAAL